MFGCVCISSPNLASGRCWRCPASRALCGKTRSSSHRILQRRLNVAKMVIGSATDIELERAFEHWIRCQSARCGGMKNGTRIFLNDSISRSYAHRSCVFLCGLQLVDAERAE